MKFKSLSHPRSTFTRVRFATCFIAAILIPLFAHAIDLLSVPAPSFSPPASAGGDSYVAAISADGRYVLFSSTANNLAHRSNNAPYLLPHPGKLNAFVHDRVSGTTTLVSKDPTDKWAGDGDSTPTAISTNGQFVLFESGSRNLVPGESIRINNSEVYLRDLVNQTTTLVSVRYRPVSVSGAILSTMTPDARYIAFSDSDSNIVAADTNFLSDVFVRDMAQGVTRLASVGFTNLTSSYTPVITPDGRFVAFAATAFSPNFTQDIYVCDMTLTNMFCVSTNSHQYISAPTCYGQEISQDGKYVAYQAQPSTFSPANAFIFRHNLQTGNDELISSNGFPASATQPLDMTPDGRFIAFIGKTNSGTGIFLWDGQTATTTFVSADTNGLAVTGMICDSPAIDATGRFVSFVAFGGGLVTNAVGSFVPHIYRRDLQSGITELVDVGLDGNATNRSINSDFYMSADGKAIVFDSPDTDLVEQDGNGASDVFVRNFDSETTELASAADSSLPTQTGGFADKRSRARVSADGHFAVFIARGDGLVAGQTNRFRQVFIRDLVNQSNSVVSVDTNGLDNADGSATDCAVSGDGRYVTFTSLADNLVQNDTNYVADVFLRDLQTGTTFLVSTNSGSPGSGNGVSLSPSVSVDGRYVTFLSQADSIAVHSGAFAGPGKTNLFQYDRTFRTNSIVTTNGFGAAAVTPDGRYVAFVASLTTGGSSDLYVWDSQIKQRVFTNLIIGNTSAITISTNGQWIAYFLTGGPPSLNLLDRLTKSNSAVSPGPLTVRPNLRFSDDARYLVYATGAANSSLDANLARDVYVFDVLTRSNLLVSRSFLTGKAPNGNSDLPDISADGRYISYQSDAPDIVPQDNNGRLKDVFLYDRQSGSTMLLSASAYGSGTADYVSQSPAFTADGQTVAFQSWASDMTTNDFNQGSDLFLFKILGSSGATNPPPVLTGQILFSPGSGSGAGQTSPQITWAAAPGVGYQVQYKTNLTDDVWLPVSGGAVIQNGVGYVNDPASDTDHRFYRIVAY
jgi:hypothetical protein